MCEGQAKPPFEARPWPADIPIHEEFHKDFEAAKKVVRKELRATMEAYPRVFSVSLPPEEAAKLQLCFDNLIYGLHGLYSLGHQIGDGETTRICHNIMYPAVFHGIGQIRKHFGLDHFGRPVKKADSAPPEDGA